MQTPWPPRWGVCVARATTNTTPSEIDSESEAVMAETNTPTPETPRVVADLASFGEVIGQLAEDKSNDWTAEISTLSDVEKELEQARRDLELYQQHFGPVEGAEETRKFADLGEYTAALYGSNTEWDIAFPEYIAEHWKEMLHGEHDLGDQDEAALAHWRTIADRLGIMHDAPE